MSDSDFVVVYTASWVEIGRLRSVLIEAGIPAVAADSHTKTIDPFITGGNIFDSDLLVPAFTVAAARDLIRDATEAGHSDLGRESTDGGRDATASPRDRAELLGRRLRWSVVLLYFAFAVPFPLLPIPVTGVAVYVWFSIAYFVRSRRLQAKPPGHGFTIASFVLLGVPIVAIGLFALCVLILVAVVWLDGSRERDRPAGLPFGVEIEGDVQEWLESSEFRTEIQRLEAEEQRTEAEESPR